MFASDYLEFKSKARKEIKDVVFKAIEITGMSGFWNLLLLSDDQSHPYDRKKRHTE